jgi:hypothetical protein
MAVMACDGISWGGARKSSSRARHPSSPLWMSEDDFGFAEIAKLLGSFGQRNDRSFVAPGRLAGHLPHCNPLLRLQTQLPPLILNAVIR